ncbi:MAG TPA: hypothetical protein DEF48_00190 [Nostoc sp. UBA8866]|jgi:hypothetical protein|uniref:Uncharacterized protein n=1 Tax=Trichormus variabilis NIES-23 TaxID=1973479 RepID=A0A1Z4KK47_ANAVA|nr:MULTISPECIES: hypothetical protein [Nostoc]RUR87391.1 hypothetical protein DSM107007_15760 [Nostoc sp. PCC 7120 = FACHB-418]BAB75386.1 all3687 [Nostoc sp. PCC 7120 = FACHB-418]BAY69314.1 hypothetical protein NIES23_21080 [Trichormus variabilis NIES-23]HBW28517.1 hypothetical protein [Nostoc sp. UBA8866]
MIKTVVNLTQQSVLGEIENVLDTYPYHPYQQAFAIPDLRQELIAFVLNRIPCLYSAISDEQLLIPSCEQESWWNNKLPRSPLEQQQHLQRLIHQGIYSIFQEKSDWISHHLCESVQVGCEPSHWFG